MRISKTLIYNFIHLNMVHIITSLFPILFLPYLLNYFGFEKFGKLSFILSISYYINLICEFGTSNYAIVESNNCNQNIKKYLFFNILITKIAFFLIVILIILLLSILANQNFNLLFFISLFNIFGNILSPFWFLQYNLDLKFYNNVLLISKILLYTILFCLINKTILNLELYFFLVALENVLSSLIGVFFIYNKYHLIIRIKSFYLSFKRIIANSKGYFISSVFTSFYTNLNIIMLGILNQPTLVGEYSFVEKFYNGAQKICTPLVQLLFPYMSRTKDIKVFISLVKIIFILEILIAFILFFNLETILNILTSNHLTSSLKYISQLFIVIFLISSLSIYLGLPLLSAFGFSKITNNSVIISSISHISLLTLFYFKNLINVKLILLSILFTEFLILIIRIFYVKKKILNVEN
jgi:PST family polysaccharide transporter